MIQFYLEDKEVRERGVAGEKMEYSINFTILVIFILF